MSAFLCSDLHTLALASALVHHGLACDAVTAAMSLRDANNKALRARYGDEPCPLGPLGSIKAQAPYTLPQLNSLARGFRYQCAEGDVLKTHPIAPALDALIHVTGGEEARTLEGFWTV